VPFFCVSVCGVEERSIEGEPRAEAADEPIRIEVDCASFDKAEDAADAADARDFND
jgi:hypothetical protein